MITTGTLTRNTSAAVSVLVAAVFITACATMPTTTPAAPDTERQKKARTDLEECNTAAGGKADGVTVTPEGKYSFRVIGSPTADRILACMTGKGYSGVRMDNPIDHGAREMIRSGGEGQPR